MPTTPSQSGNALRVAIIGYGIAGSVFHAPLISSTPGMTVAAIITNNQQRQAQARRDFPSASIFSSTEELWRDPSRYDLVIVATPNRAHVPLGLAALNSGLPVVIDKPLATSVADALQLIEASKSMGTLLSVFQNRRWDNDFLTLRKVIADDLLGPLTRYEAHYDRYRPAPRAGAWREFADPEEGGGLLYDIGSHVIDQALQLFGKPVRVYAEMDQRRPGAQVDDDTFVALQFGSGVRAHLWMSVVARIPGPRQRLLGLRGTYEKWGLDPQEDALRAGLRPGSPDWGLESREHWGRLSTDIGSLHFDGPIETLPGAYEQYYALLRAALTSGDPPPVNPEDALQTLRVIEAAQESARLGSVVEL
ncbi:MAG TPA: Gfo/Idh/MocA family oxidoreductase [Ktedonobacteraceae bacterium]|nr:Gfo/Idh/MocA family oxidoreductase [Ktedonobacteraceae bacterium]